MNNKILIVLSYCQTLKIPETFLFLGGRLLSMIFFSKTIIFMFISFEVYFLQEKCVHLPYWKVMI